MVPVSLGCGSTLGISGETHARGGEFQALDPPCAIVLDRRNGPASPCLEDWPLRTWIAVALAGSLIASVSASGVAAQPAPDRRAHSVQCLLAMAAANGAAQTPQAGAAARLGMVFFAAQLFGMDPGIDLAAAARTQLPALNKQRLQALIPLCGTEMNRREQQIAAMGAQLKGR
jgi:hypothetical protein